MSLLVIIKVRNYFTNILVDFMNDNEMPLDFAKEIEEKNNQELTENLNNIDHRSSPSGPI